MQSSRAGRFDRVPRHAAWWVTGVLAVALAGCASGGEAPASQTAPSEIHAAVARDAAADITASPGFFSRSTAEVDPADNTFTPRVGGSERTNDTSDSAIFPTYADVVSGEEPAQLPVMFSLQGTYLYGPVGGIVQIPKGGKLGTANANRPRFDDIGINNVSAIDGELDVNFDPQQQLFIGGEMIHLSGGTSLARPLTTAGVHFPKHTHVQSKIRLDWYRLGYRYDFALHQADNGVADVTLTPWIEGILWDFGYNLNGERAGTAERGFQKTGFQFGGTFAWRPLGGPLSLEAAAGSFPNIRSLEQISIESLTARYHFAEWHRFDFNVLLGVLWEQQEFRDHQSLPNRISASFGPMVQAGLQISF